MSLPLLLAWLGLGDLIALEYMRAGLAPGCGAGSACVEVTSGPYSELLGMPWTWVGMAYYVVLAALLLGRPAWARPLARLGLAATLVLVALQVAVIRSVCPFCLLSAGLCLALALLPAGPVPRRALGMVVTLLLAGLAVRAAYRDHVWLDQPVPEVSAGARHWLGSRDAPVRLVVFVSLACTHCADLLERLRAFQAQYPERVAVAVRHYPPDCPDGVACRGAAVCEAAADFWPFLARAEGLVKGGRSPEGATDMAPVAADCALATRLGLTTVPVLFVNDRRLHGPASAATLRRLLNSD